MSLKKSILSLKKGKPVVVYDSDDREGEADLIFHAKFATPKKIATLRKDAGGLICLAVSGETAKEIGLEFISDVLSRSGSKLKNMNCSKTAYGDKPAFSISINHKNVYTGITDNDRSLTITSFAKLIERNKKPEEKKRVFLDSFYTPGHVFLLIGSGIEKRKGHTELSLELANLAGLSGAMVLCEMLDLGTALPREKARNYAKKNRLVFLEGSEIHGKK